MVVSMALLIMPRIKNVYSRYTKSRRTSPAVVAVRAFYALATFFLLRLPFLPKCGIMNK